jgi:hypothetical protein
MTVVRFAVSAHFAFHPSKGTGVAETAAFNAAVVSWLAFASKHFHRGRRSLSLVRMDVADE